MLKCVFFIFRKRGLALWLFVALPFWGLAKTLPPESEGFSKTFRVGTYNVHDYFQKDRRVAGVFLKKYPKPETEKCALRETIRNVDAEVLMLQEIQKAFLEELQEDLENEGSPYPYAYILEGPDAERCLAALCKVKPKKVIKHTQLAFSHKGKACYVKRGVLELGFTLQTGDNLTIYTLHLKSKVQKNNHERQEDYECNGFRSAEAQAIRKQVLAPGALSPGAQFIIAGDFNDAPQSKALKHLQTQKHKEITTTLCERLPGVDSQDPKNPPWTLECPYTASWHTVDHILVSPALKPRVRDAQAKVAPPNAGSDHRLVYVDVRGASGGQEQVPGPGNKHLPKMHAF